MSFFSSLKKTAAAKSSAVTEAALLDPPLASADKSAAKESSFPISQARPVESENPTSSGRIATEKRIIFVGGNSASLAQIERDLVILQSNWRITHVENCPQAIEKWAAQPFEVLVLDGQVPDGAKLLKSLEKELGQSICLVRCQVLDRAASAQWKGFGATLIPHDNDAGALVGYVKRATCIRNWMADAAIKKLVSQIRKLPAQPKLHTQVTDELQSPSSSMDVVGQLIAQDPVMSAKILQVVNSAFFGLSHEVSDTTESVMVLGAERIKALILLAGVFLQYSGAKCPAFSPEPIWRHSLQVGLYARAIALTETKNTRTAEAAFTAGLLHDIGKLVIAGNLPEMYDTVNRLKTNKKIMHRAAEMEVLGTSHAELGACLLATWGLPLAILEALAWHHEPERCEENGFSLLTAVHVANAFAQENCANGEPTDAINVAYLLQAGLGDCRNRWRQACGLEPKPDQGRTPDEPLRRRREAKEN